MFFLIKWYWRLRSKLSGQRMKSFVVQSIYRDGDRVGLEGLCDSGRVYQLLLPIDRYVKLRPKVWSELLLKVDAELYHQDKHHIRQTDLLAISEGIGDFDRLGGLEITDPKIVITPTGPYVTVGKLQYLAEIDDVVVKPGVNFGHFILYCKDEYKGPWKMFEY